MSAEVILEGVVGSTAYGLAGPDSDEDRLAVHLAPLRDVLAVGWQSGSIVSHDPDRTSHELAKFCLLALKANPTVMELLWLPDDLYRVRTPIGDRLIDSRDSFLSKRASATYGGYVRQQAHRLVNRQGTFSSDMAKRTEKHGRHCWRLLLQGRGLARAGELRVRLNGDEAAECREAGALAASDPEHFARLVAGEVGFLDETFAASRLPDDPDVAWVNTLLYESRLAGQNWALTVDRVISADEAADLKRRWLEGAPDAQRPATTRPGDLPAALPSATAKSDRSVP